MPPQETATSALDRDWLAAQIAGLIGDDGPIAPDEDLTLYGLDSMGVMRLAMLLEEKGVLVSFDDLARQPTLDGWHDLIRQRAEA